MTSPATLGADDLRAVMGGYRDALRLHQADINRLNVYPVPDGDTGTNMALTLEAVVSELEGVEAGAGLPEVCKAIGHGSLMGARGNSGVILSQLLRGMSERMGARRGRPASAPTLLVDAIDPRLRAGPPGRGAPGRGHDPDRGLGRGRPGRRTAPASSASSRAPAARRPTPWPARPSMLPVLAQAGVVDAGGTGFLLLLDAFLLVLDGRPLPEPSGVAAPRPHAP